MNFSALGASFLGSGVEFVEALTIVLAVGTVRGWKSAFLGALAAVAVLSALVLIIGLPLVSVVRLLWVQMLVGGLMLLFGARWLKKAILRFSGIKSLHDEGEAFSKEVARQRAEAPAAGGIDRFGFLTAFSGTLLEGTEAVIIVITLGLSAHALRSTVAGAVLATFAVLVLGALLKQPLSRIPENTLKFLVGVMLTSFGTFWLGEGLQVPWPLKDAAVLYIAASLCLFSLLLVGYCRRALAASEDTDREVDEWVR